MLHVASNSELRERHSDEANMTALSQVALDERE